MSIAFSFSLDADCNEEQPLFERAPADSVALTVEQEGTNLLNDEPNFKDVTTEQADLGMNPPKDRYILRKYKRV